MLTQWVSDLSDWNIIASSNFLDGSSGIKKTIFGHAVSLSKSDRHCVSADLGRAELKRNQEEEDEEEAEAEEEETHACLLLVSFRFCFDKSKNWDWLARLSTTRIEDGGVAKRMGEIERRGARRLGLSATTHVLHHITSRCRRRLNFFSCCQQGHLVASK